MAPAPESLLARIRQARGVACDWLAAHAERSNPRQWHGGGELLFRRKCFNELALFLMWHERFPQYELAGVRAIRAYICSQVGGDYLGMALRRPERLLMYNCALGYAVHRGVFDTRQAARVREVLAGPFAWSLDNTVFRQLDLVLACHFAGATPPLAAADLFRVSALAAPPSPLYGTRDAFYAVTHAAFYAFLLQQPVLAPARLAVSVKGGLCRALAAHDLDLGLELLMTQLLQGLPLEAEGLLLLEAVLAPLLAGADVGNRQHSMDVAAFLAEQPAEAGWAPRFHLMLVAALALLLAEHAFASAAPAQPAAHAGAAARALGQSLLALQRYHFTSGLRPLLGFQPGTPQEAALLDEIVQFLQLHAHGDGQYGHFVDELQRFGRDPAQAAALRAPINQACRAFLQAQPATCS